jgi:predicted transcriptional regulator
MFPLLIAIRPRFGEAILSGRKRVELRKRFPDVAPGSLVYLYASSPTQQVIGGFRIEEILEGVPSEIWRVMKDELMIDYHFFRDYTKGQQLARALRVSGPFRLRRASPREELVAVDPEFAVPQSYCYIRSRKIAAHLRALS